MLSISAILFISSALCLSSWIVFEKTALSKFLRLLFFVSFLGFVGFSFLEWTIHAHALFFILIKIFALSGIASIFLLFRSSKMVSFFLWLMLFAAVPYSYNYLINNEVPEPASELEYAPDGEILLQLDEYSNPDDVQNQIAKAIPNVGLTRAFSPIEKDKTILDDYFFLDIPNEKQNEIDAIIQTLRTFSAVKWAEPNETLKNDPIESKNSNITIPKLKFSDPLIDKQWAAEALEFDKFHEYIKKQKIKPRKKAKLFILDTGVNANHEDLKVNYKSLDSQSDTDDVGHGTHCAGIAAAVTNNKKGIASLVPNKDFVEVTGLKVLTMYGYGTQGRIIDNIIKAVDNGADVISLSLGGKSSQTREKAYNDVVAYANLHQTILVIAAGNSSKDASTFSPANSQWVIAVSAFDRNMERAFFSNTLEHIKFGISGPGHEILSTFPKEDQYKIFSGTSMATPYVASLAAMLKSIHPELTTQEFYRIIHNTGKIPKEEFKTGRLLQPYLALRLLNEEMSN